MEGSQLIISLKPFYLQIIRHSPFKQQHALNIVSWVTKLPYQNKNKLILCSLFFYKNRK